MGELGAIYFNAIVNTTIWEETMKYYCKRMNCTKIALYHKCCAVTVNEFLSQSGRCDNEQNKHTRTVYFW